MSGDLALSVMGLTVRPVIHDLDVALTRGQVLVVRDESGRAATAFLQCVAGELEPDEGTVNTGDARVVRGMRVEDLDLDYPAWAHADALDVDRTRFAELLGTFDVAHRAADIIGYLSRGNRQRVAMALTLSLPADLLLVIDPFATLDPRGRADVVAELATFCAGGGTAVVATEDLDMVPEFAHQVLAL